MKTLTELIKYEPTEDDYKELVYGRVIPLIQQKYNDRDVDFEINPQDVVHQGYTLIFTLVEYEELRDIRKIIFDKNMTDEGINKAFKEAVIAGDVIPVGESDEIQFDEDVITITTLRFESSPSVIISFTDSKLREKREKRKKELDGKFKNVLP